MDENEKNLCQETDNETEVSEISPEGAELARMCGVCTNRRTPMCEFCTYVEDPSGSVSTPSLFMQEADYSDDFKAEVESVEDDGERLKKVIELCIKGNIPIPLYIVLAYNMSNGAKRHEPE